jgi:hypothetical protein
VVGSHETILVVPDLRTPLTDGGAITVGSVHVRFCEWTDTASRTRRIRGAARMADRQRPE